MDDSFLDKWPGWLRWVLAWPAGILGSLIIAFIMRLIWSGSNENAAPWFLDLIQAGFIGFLAIYIPSLFVPTNKKTVAIVSLCVFIALVFLLVGFVMYGTMMGVSLEDPLMFWLTAIVYVGAGVGATVAVHSDD